MTARVFNTLVKLGIVDNCSDIGEWFEFVVEVRRYERKMRSMGIYEADR